MKLLQDEVNHKDERAAIAVLIVFILASILSAWVIVYIINFLFTGAQE